MSEQLNRVLMVDDEFDLICHYIHALRARGVIVDFVPTLREAYVRLAEGSAAAVPYDLVVIDLYMGDIPESLQPYYRELKVGQHNDGQALGQWLWEISGAATQSKGPAHCYLTNFDGLYSLHSQPDSDKQEFGRQDENAVKPRHAEFMLSKFEVRPSMFHQKLLEVMQAWQRLK